jgi:integrase
VIPATVVRVAGQGLVAQDFPKTERRLLRARVEEIDWMTPKSGRGAVATLLRNEVDIDAAKERLGHADWHVTDRHYTTKQISRSDRPTFAQAADTSRPVSN